MSNEAADRQRKIAEFMQILPLTAQIAGLSLAELGRHFNEGQMDVRCNTLRLAYQHAQQLASEASRLMQLLPLAIEIAGLHRAEPGKFFSEGQLDVRTNTLRNAFKAAHQLVLAISKFEPPPTPPTPPAPPTPEG
jgi:hypothetical protein